MKRNLGRMYVGNIEKAIADYTNKHGKPVAIYCNDNEFTDVELTRIAHRLPPGNFILTDYIDERKKK